MKKSDCMFVFFMICNGIFGLCGLILLGYGIYAVVKIDVSPVNIGVLIFGAYSTLILILGVFSWKKQGLLIAYFVLIILLFITELVFHIIVPLLNTLQVEGGIFFAVIFFISFWSSLVNFVFSMVYFCLLRKEEQNLYNDVKNLDYVNYQNI